MRRTFRAARVELFFGQGFLVKSDERQRREGEVGERVEKLRRKQRNVVETKHRDCQLAMLPRCCLSESLPRSQLVDRVFHERSLKRSRRESSRLVSSRSIKKELLGEGKKFSDRFVLNRLFLTLMRSSRQISLELGYTESIVAGVILLRKQIGKGRRFPSFFESVKLSII